MAAALVEGRVGLAQFTPDRFAEAGVTDPRIRPLLDRIRVSVDPGVTARYPAEWGTRIRFTRKDGTVSDMSAAFPKGNPENPVTTAALEAKLRDLVSSRLGVPAAERAIAAVGALESCPDMAGAFAGLDR